MAWTPSLSLQRTGRKGPDGPRVLAAHRHRVPGARGRGDIPGPVVQPKQMTTLLLKLLNVPVDDAVRIAGASLAFRGGLSAGWFVFLVLVTAAAGGTGLSISPITVAPWRRYVLTATARVVRGDDAGAAAAAGAGVHGRGQHPPRAGRCCSTAAPRCRSRIPRLDPERPEARRHRARTSSIQTKGLNQSLDRSRARELRADLARRSCEVGAEERATQSAAAARQGIRPRRVQLRPGHGGTCGAQRRVRKPIRRSARARTRR